MKLWNVNIATWDFRLITMATSFVVVAVLNGLIVPFLLKKINQQFEEKVK